MFTGIIEEIGKVIAINKTRADGCLKIKVDTIHSDAKMGDSICIDGVCLSITDIKGNILKFDVIHETLRKTTLSELKVNDFVNLERSLRVDSRLGGHFVSGHIDYKGRIEQILKGPEGTGFKVSLPSDFSSLVAEKGSIALDGISLTVAKVAKMDFTVYLIPHTLKVTTLGKKRRGDSVNIERDLLAKYLTQEKRKTNTEGLLKKYNYI